MIGKKALASIVNERNAFYLLLAMHVAGAIGLSLEQTAALFKYLTPFNLVVSAAIVLHFEEKKSWRFGLFILLTFLIGFFVEVIGVKTGSIFGDYAYGETLGIKVLEVPLSIGINWVMLIYSTGLFSRVIFKKPVYQVFSAAALMTLLDYLIEPVAINYDFWQWYSDHIPLQNYVAWFFVSLALHLVFRFFMSESHNSLAVRFLYIQTGFFLILHFI